jgi:hypothetical protein
MEELEDLLDACRNGDYQRSEEDDFENDADAPYPITKVYKVDGGDHTLIYWNSSNNERINHEEVLELIADEIEHDECYDGIVQDEYTWAEIMYEVQ